MATGKEFNLSGIPKKQEHVKRVVTTAVFDVMLFNAVDFGEQIFGVNIANTFLLNVRKSIKTPSTQYQFYPENKLLLTKTKMYRNIILGKYMILYRIKPTTVEVLAIYHSSIKPSKVKKLRSIKP